MMDEKRKRKKEVFLALVTLVAILAVTFFKFKASIGGNLFFFTMLNVNVILFLLLVFLVIRNIGKVLLERRRGILGSKLKTRLVMAFLLLSLVPATMLFFVSSVFIGKSVQGWFSQQVGRSLEGALEVAGLYYEDFSKRSTELAERALKGEPLVSLLEAKDASWVGVFDRKGRLRERVALIDGVYPPYDLLEVALKTGKATKVTSFGGKEVFWGAYAKGDRVAAVGFELAKGVFSKVEDIRRAHQDYRRSEGLKGVITFNYLLLLLTVTFLVVFWAIWLGLRIAKDVTQPIGALLEGTRRIAEGDLDHKVEVPCKDEMVVLIEGFNKMTQDLKRAKQALEERRHYIEAVLESISAGVISFDNKGRITTINRRAAEILEIKEEDALGRYYREVLKPDFVKVARDLLREMNKRGIWRAETQKELSVNGKVMTLRVSLNALRDRQGEYLGMVVVFDDLTQLVKIERLSTWREVARRIAHEIKNPLTPIQLSAERIWRRWRDRIVEDREVFDECVQTIVKQVKALKRMINEFSQFARMPDVSPRLDDLNEVVKESVVLFREAHPRVEFGLYLDPQLPKLKFDKDAMKMVLANLLSNAIEALDGTGRIEVQTHFEPQDQVAVLEVRDNGCGVPDELKPKLFEPYFSTKGEGRGLGLAIVNAIVADHGGSIRVRDNVPCGTRFIIELPLRK